MEKGTFPAAAFEALIQGNRKAVDFHRRAGPLEKLEQAPFIFIQEYTARGR